MTDRGRWQTIIVMGVSGSGKTTVAQGMAEAMGWTFAEGDDFHPPANVAKMAAGYPLTDEDRWPWLRAIRTWLDQQAEGGRSVVVACSALKRSYRDLLRDGHPGIRFCELDAPSDLIADRLSQRQGHYMPPSLLPSQFATLESLQPDEPGVRVSVASSLDVIVQDALAQLDLDRRPPNPTSSKDSTDPTDSAPAVRAVRGPTQADLQRAAGLISRMLAPTPVNHGADVTLKLEGLQPTGSFKVRGALAALAALDPGVRTVTASAGNHALGIAYAATRLGREATVVTSTKASPVKIAAIKGYDVELVQIGTSYDDAEAHAMELAAHGAHYISAYNDPQVIAGQASIGFELERQVDGPMTVVCGVGGGGLASGLGMWASTRADVRIVGVEVAVSTAVSAAVAAGRQVRVEVGETLADGMAGNIEDGSVTIELVSRYVDQLVTVTEDEIRAALVYLLLERGIVAEGSGAAPVAAVLAGRVPVRAGETVVAVVSGRNIAPALLAQALAGQL
jgi:threonine dehydratase